MQFAGDKQVLIQNDQRWEGKVVEAPFMWKHAGRYYLFYSGNSYQSPEYAVGYAVADHITGKLQAVQSQTINNAGHASSCVTSCEHHTLPLHGHG